jgi:antitoxin HicB
MTASKKPGQTIAIFSPSPEGGFDVSFPDYQGCVTFGRTLPEAKRMAREVLGLWLEELGSASHPVSKRATIFKMPLPKSRMSQKRASYETAARKKAYSHS